MPRTESADKPSGPLRFNLRHLEVFVAMALQGSTRAAALAVSRSQSATSSTLSELEAALGAPLFDRVGRRLVLNELGRSLLPRALGLIDEAAQIQRLAGNELSGPLCIAASLTVGDWLLPAVLCDWRAQHPETTVRMQLSNSSDILQAIASFDAEIGFIEGPQTHAEVRTRPWLSDEMVIVAAPDHPIARRQASLRALQDCEWALREAGSGTRQVTERWLLEHLDDLRIAYEVGSAQALLQLVQASRTLGCLSRLAAQGAIRQGLVREVRSPLPPASRRLAIAVHHERKLSARAQGFMQACLKLKRMPAQQVGPSLHRNLRQDA